MNRDWVWLTKDQFARLKPLLPSDTRGKPRVDDRRVISGIVHVLKSGGRWIDAPDVYGPYKTLYNRFVRWAAKGVWFDIFDILALAGGPPAQVLIDSSAVKAHMCVPKTSSGRRLRFWRKRPFLTRVRLRRRLTIPSSMAADHQAGSSDGRGTGVQK